MANRGQVGAAIADWPWSGGMDGQGQLWPRCLSCPGSGWSTLWELLYSCNAVHLYCSTAVLLYSLLSSFYRAGGSCGGGTVVLRSHALFRNVLLCIAL